MTYELKMECPLNPHHTLAWDLIRVLLRIRKDKHVASLGPNQNCSGPFWGGKILFLRMCFSERNPHTRLKIDVSSCFRCKSFGSSYECIQVPTALFPSTWFCCYYSWQSLTSRWRLPSKAWGKIMHLDIKGQNIMFQVSYKGAGIGAVDGAGGVEGFVGWKKGRYSLPPLKINIKHNHGGFEDHFPF